MSVAFSRGLLYNVRIGVEKVVEKVYYYKMQKLHSRFFFDHVGAKKKTLQKESAVWGFRRLRAATSAPRRWTRAAF